MQVTLTCRVALMFFPPSSVPTANGREAKLREPTGHGITTGDSAVAPGFWFRGELFPSESLTKLLFEAILEESGFGDRVF